MRWVVPLHTECVYRIPSLTKFEKVLSIIQAQFLLKEGLLELMPETDYVLNVSKDAH
jgi:hypothetical protein